MNNLNKQITDHNRVTFIEAKLSCQGNKLSYMTVMVLAIKYTCFSQLNSETSTPCPEKTAP